MKMNIRNESVSCKWCRAEIAVWNGRNGLRATVNINKACVQDVMAWTTFPLNQSSRTACLTVLWQVESFLDRIQFKFREKVSGELWSFGVAVVIIKICLTFLLQDALPPKSCRFVLNRICTTSTIGMLPQTKPILGVAVMSQLMNPYPLNHFGDPWDG